MLTVDFNRLPLRAGENVLDLGSGNGRHAFAALRHGADVVACDHDPAGLAEVATMFAAMRLAGEVPPEARATTVCADARRLPFATASFDRIIAAEVLEHIHDDEVAMRELFRVLREGGLVAVTVPRWFPERVCWALSEQYHRVEGGHVRIYTRRTLRRRLTATGLVGYARHHAHALHSPYWWVKCAVGVDRDHALARLYHRLLVWDIVRRPWITRTTERALNPILGKSLVVYLRKPEGAGRAA
ncbi:MAG TPA: class I SAM-dependent methyltransferase [Mycobacteriales bacterium]|nr:class I SAM-dependent methyltransferase [Mycobacteriales bacterium]